jgi:hypothetical protein
VPRRGGHAGNQRAGATAGQGLSTEPCVSPVGAGRRRATSARKRSAHRGFSFSGSSICSNSMVNKVALRSTVCHCGREAVRDL